eukprot:6189620-Pleurochrysis_carterae.AAC.2
MKVKARTGAPAARPMGIDTIAALSACAGSASTASVAMQSSGSSDRMRIVESKPPEVKKRCKSGSTDTRDVALSSSVRPVKVLLLLKACAAKRRLNVQSGKASVRTHARACAGVHVRVRARVHVRVRGDEGGTSCGEVSHRQPRSAPFASPQAPRRCQGTSPRDLRRCIADVRWASRVQERLIESHTGQKGNRKGRHPRADAGAQCSISWN